MTQKSTYLVVDIKRNASTDPISPIDFEKRGKIITSSANVYNVRETSGKD